MKWFTGMRIVVAVALVVLMAAPVALCAVNTQPQHSCCDGMMDDQPAPAPSCCAVQAPTQPSVTTHFDVERLALPTVSIVTAEPMLVSFSTLVIPTTAEFSSPPLTTILRI